MTFGPESSVFWRESSSGISASIYFTGKVFFDIFRIVTGSFWYTCGLVIFFSHSQSFESFYVTVLALYLSAFPMGYCISIWVTSNHQSVYGIGWTLFWSVLLAGINPEISDISPQFRFMFDLSPSRYFIEAFWIKETQTRSFVQKEPPIEHFSFDGYPTCMRAMAYFGLFWFFFSWLNMLLCNRRQRS